jgi:mono/diheme cytochrome c family protein
MLAAAIVVVTWGEIAPAQDIKALEAQGKEILQAQCGSCHAILRSGESPHAAAPAFRTLSQRYPIDGLAESLAEGLSVGHSEMPEFAFETDEIAAILAYLKSIQER